MDGYYETLDMEEMNDLEFDGFDGFNEEFGDPESLDMFDFESQPDGEFIKSLLKKARKVVSKVASSPIGAVLKNVANQAATVAGGAIAGPAGAKIASQIAGRVLRESDYEGEFDMEADDEADFEAMGGDLEVLMEMQNLAAMAADSESEEQADQFIGAIANLAGSLLPSLFGGGDSEAYGFDGEDEYSYEQEDEFLPALIPLATSLLPAAIPWIKKGVNAIGKVLNSSKRTRRATLQALPKIASKAVTAVAKQARTGNLTPQKVAAVVGKTAAQSLASPKKVVQAARPVAAAQGPARPRSAGRPMGGSVQSGMPRRGRRRISRPRYCVE